MIQFNHVAKSFGAQPLFDDLTFTVNRRERVGLVGRNGHGKTTVFRMILVEVPADGGDILIPKRYRIGHLDQQLHFSEATVLDEAVLGLPEEHRDERWRAEQILSGLGFSRVVEAARTQPFGFMPEVVTSVHTRWMNLST